jgi:chorismate mutase
MDNLQKYYVVSTSVVPDIFKKVIEVKKMIQSGKTVTINEAVRNIGISRSTYYKYKDHIYLYSEMSQDNIVTLFFVLEDISGILSDILNIIALSKANVLTINQNIPVNEIANITISLRVKNMQSSVEDLIKKLEKIDGIKKIKIIS